MTNALIPSQIANRASRAQGQGFLAAAAGAFGDERIRLMRSQAQQERRPAHHAPVFGAIGRLLGIEREAVLRLHFHALLRSLISAAVRLNAIGPLEGQTLHRTMASRAEATLRRGLTLPLDQAATIDPLLDLVQGCQDRLYSRLFTS